MPHLLVADNNKDDVMLLGEAFRLIGADVQITSVSEGQRAVESLTNAASPFDVVILDYYLPRYSARELLEQITRAGSLLRRPAVVLSSHFGRGEAEHLKSLGASLVAEKPNDVEGLCDLARQVLNLATQPTPAPSTS
jgi:CheY-like chemotaxis protein